MFGGEFYEKSFEMCDQENSSCSISGDFSVGKSGICMEKYSVMACKMRVLWARVKGMRDAVVNFRRIMRGRCRASCGSIAWGVAGRKGVKHPFSMSK